MIKLGKQTIIIIVTILLLVVASVTTIIVVATDMRTENASQNSEIVDNGGGDNSQQVTTSKTDELAVIIANSPDVYSDYVYYIDSEGNIYKEHLNFDAIETSLENLCEEILNILHSEFGNVDAITSVMMNSNALFNKMDDLFNLLAANAQ